jgi:hypothetical protein
MAIANCHDTTASVDSEAQPGIAKDGSRVPFETDATADVEGRVEGGPANKNGNTMPLANQQGGGNKNIATSQTPMPLTTPARTKRAEASDRGISRSPSLFRSGSFFGARRRIERLS